MNIEETIFPRREYIRGQCAKSALPTYKYRMSIDCSSPWFKILANFSSDLKQNALFTPVVLLYETTFARQSKFNFLCSRLLVVFLHRLCEKLSLCKVKHFSATNAQKMRILFLQKNLYITWKCFKVKQLYA